MFRLYRSISFLLAGAAFAALTFAGAASTAAGGHTTKPFSGAKVNGGTATLETSGGTRTLTLSDDFKVPDTPDPHWQVVDAKGTTFLLQRLAIKGDKVNKTITLPAYIKDVAKVQIYCAWAEALLGEASFGSPQGTN
jgi:hypothetical protein